MITARIEVNIQRLKELPERLQKNTYKRAIRAGANVLKADIKANVATRSGALRQSITVKVDTARGETVAYGVVGPKSKYTKAWKGRTVKPSRYAAPLEKGKFKRPFLLPAWNANKSKYLAAIQAVIAKEIQTQLGG